ncbi:MAG: helix-turn-helix domain-containing protein [Clostridia bacterium]|nr:helix-turn-helix domain-containing protein [Clostridia bacterium]
MSIGENIKKHRLTLGLTQDKLGELLGVTGKAVSTWEKGIKIPRMPIITRLAALFEVPKSLLIDDESDKKRDPIVHIPLVGRVAAGEGCLAEDDYDGYEPVPADILTPDEKYIFLNVKGDSMSPKIEEGDRLLVQLQPSVDSGSFAVVVIDDEDGVVKKVCYTADRIKLISENPYYPPRVFSGPDVTRVRVVGLVKYVFRKL